MLARTANSPARNGAARYNDGTLIGTALGLNGMLARLIPQTTMLVLTPVITLAMMANISLTGVVLPDGSKLSAMSGSGGAGSLSGKKSKEY